MNITQVNARSTTTTTSADAAVPFRLEVVVIPVADPSRAKKFFLSLGWRLDADFPGENGYRVLQVTPPGSNASVIFGSGVTAAAPGALDGLVLVVDDVTAARADLLSAGVDVSAVFHDAGGGLGGGFHIGNEARANGPDPEHRSYASYASFHDSEGNRWILQEIGERLPGRERDTRWDVATLAELLQETAEHHDSFEKASPPHDWWDWYAAYLHERQHGNPSQDAARAADTYMAEAKHVIAAH